MLYVAKNSVLTLRSVKWTTLRVDNKEDDEIVENSLFVKPFVKLVELIYYDNNLFFPRSLLSNIDEAIMLSKFKQEKITIKEYRGKKLDVITQVEECSPSELKLEL